MNYQQFLDYANDHIQSSKALATNDEELAELLSRARTWLEGFAAGLHEGGCIGDEELDNAPADVVAMMN